MKNKHPTHKTECNCPFCKDKSGKNNPFYNKHHTEETRRKMKLVWDKRKKTKKFWIKKKKLNQLHSLNMKKIWDDDNSIYNSKCYRKLLSKNHIHTSIYFNRSINKKEAILNGIIRSIRDNEFIYVGDNPVIFYTFKKYPDFVDFNNKKIIELFGDYWHSKEKTGNDKRTEENIRKNYFKVLGYQTLIIWEHELNGPNKVKIEIEQFNHSGLNSPQLAAGRIH